MGARVSIDPTMRDFLQGYLDGELEQRQRGLEKKIDEAMSDISTRVDLIQRTLMGRITELEAKHESKAQFTQAHLKRLDVRCSALEGRMTDHEDTRVGLLRSILTRLDRLETESAALQRRTDELMRKRLGLELKHRVGGSPVSPPAAPPPGFPVYAAASIPNAPEF